MRERSNRVMVRASTCKTVSNSYSDEYVIFELGLVWFGLSTGLRSPNSPSTCDKQTIDVLVPLALSLGGWSLVVPAPGGDF